MVLQLFSSIPFPPHSKTLSSYSLPLCIRLTPSLCLFLNLSSNSLPFCILLSLLSYLSPRPSPLHISLLFSLPLSHLTYPDCGVVVHKHCEYRNPPCKAQIESGSYVTMSRKKIVKALDDLDDLAQFLLHKISLLNQGGYSSSKVDQVFETALYELHNSLVSNYSLKLQVHTIVIDNAWKLH